MAELIYPRPDITAQVVAMTLISTYVMTVEMN